MALRTTQTPSPLPPPSPRDDPRGMVAAARARGLVTSAEKRLQDEEPAEAARLLFEAAALLVDAAARAHTDHERRMRHDLAVSLHRRAGRLVGKAQVEQANRGQDGTTARHGPIASSLEGRRLAPMPGTKSATTPEADVTSGIRPATTPGITFDHVVGMEGVKEEIRKKIIAPLQHPEVFARYGKAAGGAILMHGPPGCGKTFIAQAAAGESGAAFFPLQLADVLSKYVGDSEKTLRDLFAAARAHRPSIVFLDEIDALGGDRTQQQSDHGKRLLNQLLTLMDGVTDDGGDPLDGILVIGATNIPQSLDPALVRSGRFTTKIEIPLPDEATRRRLAERSLVVLGSPPDLVDDVVRATSDGNAADVVARCDEIIMERIMAEIDAGQAPSKGA